MYSHYVNGVAHLRNHSARLHPFVCGDGLFALGLHVGSEILAAFW